MGLKGQQAIDVMWKEMMKLVDDKLSKIGTTVSSGDTGNTTPTISSEIIQVNTFLDLPSLGKKDGVYFVKDELSTYCWNDNELKYQCRGRDYSQIELIDGGNADG